MPPTPFAAAHRASRMHMRNVARVHWHGPFWQIAKLCWADASGGCKGDREVRSMALLASRQAVHPHVCTCVFASDGLRACACSRTTRVKSLRSKALSFSISESPHESAVTSRRLLKRGICMCVCVHGFVYS